MRLSVVSRASRSHCDWHTGYVATTAPDRYAVDARRRIRETYRDLRRLMPEGDARRAVIVLCTAGHLLRVKPAQDAR